MTTEFVILVDEHDHETATCEKLAAHQQGLLHRAISVFIFNSKKEMLLQQRASTKYHSGGLWTNACCSHPRPGESTAEAAKRRLKEEMGIVNDDLQFLFSFIYKAQLDNQLTEHELDHVYVGITDAMPLPDPSEVSSYKWVNVDHLSADIAENPANYTVWFKLIFERVIKEAQNKGII